MHTPGTNRQAQRESCSDGGDSNTHKHTLPLHISLTHWFFNEIWFTIRAASPGCQGAIERTDDHCRSRRKANTASGWERERRRADEALLGWRNGLGGGGVNSAKVTAEDLVQRSLLSCSSEKVWGLKQTMSLLQSDTFPLLAESKWHTWKCVWKSSPGEGWGVDGECWLPLTDSKSLMVFSSSCHHQTLKTRDEPGADDLAN